jgi:hypothetical protein
MAATVEKLADAIIAMAQLAPDERESVMHVVAALSCQTAATSEIAAKPEKRLPRNPYSSYEVRQLKDYIAAEASYTAKEQQSIRRTFAAEFGRSRKAIDAKIGKLRDAKPSEVSHACR